jgi:hypothetical protein
VIAQEVVPRSPRAILDELAARHRKAQGRGGGVGPEIALYLVSGPIIVGRVLAVADDRGVALAVLHISGHVHAPRVVTVRVEHVIAVAHDLLPPAEVTTPAPGRLEVARALAAFAPAIASRLGIGLELRLADDLDDAARHAVSAATPTLGALLTTLAADEQGRAALLMLTTVRVGAAATGAVRRDGAVLVIEVPRGLDDAWSEAEARAAVERAL